jgi:mannosyltransferase
LARAADAGVELPDTIEARRTLSQRDRLSSAGSGFGARLALITAFGAIFRLALLARQPLGVDEDFTAAVVGRPLGDMLGVVSRDSAPPLFYMAEWLVAQLTGGPAALRLVPALAGIALIPLLAALARRVAGDRAGLWAAAFVAVLPTTLLASENARMYSMAGAVGRGRDPVVVARGRTSSRRTDEGRSGRASGTWVAYAAARRRRRLDRLLRRSVALAGMLVAVLWLRPDRRSLVLAGAATAIAIATIGPWLLFAHAQFEHAGQGFWIPPLSPVSIGGTFGQLFAGPPVDSGVPYREALVALQVLAVVAGSLAVAAALALRRGTEARRAAVFLLLACSGVVALAVVSFWRPLLEARYAGVMWLPLFALAGIGLAAVPRRIAATLLVALAVASLALGTAITHPETASLLPEIESRAGSHDLVATDPDHYFAVLAQGGPRTLARLHVLAAADPPWYFGTAAYPPDAVVHSVPADVTAAGGTIFYVADPDATPPSLPAGYRFLARRCAVRVCLTTYAPGG